MRAIVLIHPDRIRAAHPNNSTIQQQALRATQKLNKDWKRHAPQAHEHAYRDWVQEVREHAEATRAGRPVIQTPSVPVRTISTV